MPLVLAVHSVPSVSANVPFAVILLQVSDECMHGLGALVRAGKQGADTRGAKTRWTKPSPHVPPRDPHSGRDRAEADAGGPALQAGASALNFVVARWLLGGLRSAQI